MLCSAVWLCGKPCLPSSRAVHVAQASLLPKQFRRCPNTPNSLPFLLCLQSVVSVLRNCIENSSQLAAAVAASAATRGGARSAADPTRVQQIVEMGFSQAQAEEALRRVG